MVVVRIIFDCAGVSLEELNLRLHTDILWRYFPLLWSKILLCLHPTRIYCCVQLAEHLVSILVMF